MVADYTMYSSFLEMMANDEYSAQSATNNYLYAVFEQVDFLQCHGNKQHMLRYAK